MKKLALNFIAAMLLTQTAMALTVEQQREALNQLEIAQAEIELGSNIQIQAS